MNLCILKSWGIKLLEDIAPFIVGLLILQVTLSFAAVLTVIINAIFVRDDLPVIINFFAWMGLAEILLLVLLWISVRYEEAKDECSPNKRS